MLNFHATEKHSEEQILFKLWTIHFSYSWHHIICFYKSNKTTTFIIPFNIHYIIFIASLLLLLFNTGKAYRMACNKQIVFFRWHTVFHPLNRTSFVWFQVCIKPCQKLIPLKFIFYFLHIPKGTLDGKKQQNSLKHFLLALLWATPTLHGSLFLFFSLKKYHSVRP